MTRVDAIILHARPPADAGPLEAAFAAAKAANADRQARGFRAAGADVRVVETEPGGASFGARLRALAAGRAGAGLVVLGSGSVPLASDADRRAFVAAAADVAGSGAMLANNRFSADILAIPASVDLAELPDVASDNGVPRWLADRGVEVRDLRRRWRLGVDLDSPIDLLACGLAAAEDPSFARARDAVLRVAACAADPAAELVVAGRTSAATLRWLETRTSSRTRALVEERGLRTAADGQRPARSILGLLLDRDGPTAIGRILGELGDAAVIDTRVLLAHRRGRDEAGWPPAEDRFASDLLLHERIGDPWLRDLTRAAADARTPIVFGGHTVVGPGLPVLLGLAGR
ncbi:MAG TPA: hypothetical protein VFO50_01215 [Candidatus Limnocylindrales bacterium]|nr:hypothetical protein [Candidatus Limnocylindrales bacterium]